jgi:mannose-6-phosphate isomerase-like protein (cupin superfamily)
MALVAVYAWRPAKSPEIGSTPLILDVFRSWRTGAVSKLAEGRCMRSGETIRNNATGETLTMLEGELESGGVRQLYEVWLPPGVAGPPLHYHLAFTETFTVVEGALDFYLGRERRRVTLRAGDTLTAELRQLHTFANNGNAPVRFRIETRPPGGVVAAFQLAFAVANAGGAAKDGLPKNPLIRLRFLRLTQGFVPGLPLWLQRGLFRLAR